jgi:hypothetical protein
MATQSSAGRARKRARLVKCGALAASATAMLAAAPVAAAHTVASSPFGRISDHFGPHHFGRRHLGPHGDQLQPGSLVISGTVYPRNGSDFVTAGQTLPFANNYSSSLDPEPTTDPGFSTAVTNGQYPFVFNNASADGSFGVSTPIDLFDVGLGGQPLGVVQVPTSGMTTSFESKSELALNVSTNGQDLSFLGYDAPVGTLDASNSNTPGVFDPTNPDVTGENSSLTAGGVYRVAGDLSSDGRWTFTDTNAYSGDNGRAALLENTGGLDNFVTAGNDNNGNTGKQAYPTIPPDLVNATGAQTFAQSTAAQGTQAPGAPTQLATFSVTSLGDPADKAGKDMNFRGLTEFDNVVYYTKGSGSNGVNTVYFVDTTGKACSNGVGVPAAGAPAPAPGTTYQLCILKGFNTQLAATDNNDFPFGLWFANKDTLYVADEGNGNFDTSTDPVNDPYQDAQDEVGNGFTGLQKWTFNGTEWVKDYTVQNGLNLGQSYTVGGYPTGDNSGTGGTGEPWAPATDGLRNISGHANPDGTVTIYATTSTVSGSGDQGGDPNQVVAVNDRLSGDTLPASERFHTIAPPRFGVRYGGVAVLPDDFGVGQHGRGRGAR